jgi:hypothetical protein
MSQPEIHPASDQSGPAALQLSRADRKARGTCFLSTNVTESASKDYNKNYSKCYLKKEKLSYD